MFPRWANRDEYDLLGNEFWVASLESSKRSQVGHTTLNLRPLLQPGFGGVAAIDWDAGTGRSESETQTQVGVGHPSFPNSV